MKHPLVRTAVLLAVALVAFPVAGISETPKITSLSIVSYLPKDPLMAWAAETGNAARQLDSLLQNLRRLLPPEESAKLDDAMAQIDRKLGIDLRNDLLKRLGPEMAASVDLPPVDSVAAALMAGAPDALASMLGRTGIWIQVREPEKLGAALRTALEHLGLRLSTENGVTKVLDPSGVGHAGSKEPEVAFYYRISGGILALGFDPAAVRAMSHPRPGGERLTAGADFQKVFSQLDPAPRSLTYVNLPRFQEMIRSSEMIKGMAAGESDAARVRTFLLDPRNATSGFGLTRVAVAGGVRQTSFGPGWLAGGGFTVGMLAAIAIPNLLNAIDRTRVKTTLADLRSAAAAIEAYRANKGSLPGPRGRWVELSTLAGALVPAFIAILPERDSWNHPILYWTDGTHYRLISPGKDGATSRDWSKTSSTVQTKDFNGDLVLGDGVVLSSPGPESGGE